MLLQSTNKLLLQRNMKEKHVSRYKYLVLSNIASGVVTHSGMLISIPAALSRLAAHAYQCLYWQLSFSTVEELAILVDLALQRL